MKTKFYIKGIIGFFTLMMVIGGCKKDEEGPAFEELSFDAEEVLAILPEGLKNSSDEKAELCMSYIESALDMSAFMDNMIPPDGAQKEAKKSTASGDTWSWTWAYGGDSYTFYWSYDEDNTKRYWTMDIQFGAGPRYGYIEAWEMKDGSQGEVIYNFSWVYLYSGETIEDYDDLYWKYSWSVDQSGKYYLDWYWSSSEVEYDYQIHYSIEINPDGSGILDYYLMDVLFYHMEWDTLGNGSWYYYFGDDTLSGSWTVD